MAYATNANNDKPGSGIWCAEFVAKALKAGGFEIPNAWVSKHSDHIDNAARNPYINAPGQYYWFKNVNKVVSVIDNPSTAQKQALQKGDLVYTKTWDEDDQYLYTHGHVMIVTEVSGSGNSKVVKVSARNNAQTNVTLLAWNSSGAETTKPSQPITAIVKTSELASTTIAAPCASHPVLVAKASPPSGTPSTRYTYTVETDTEVLELRFSFNGNNTVYTVKYPTATLSPAKWGGTTEAKVTNTNARRTWVISNDQLGAGDRTITVTPNSCPAGSMSFKVKVGLPTITSAVATPSTGPSTGKFGYKVVTSTDVTKLRFSFNDNSNVYEVTSGQVLTPTKWGGTTTASVATSGSARTWTINNDMLGKGNRTVTVTAYNANGTATATFTVKVT